MLRTVTDLVKIRSNGPGAAAKEYFQVTGSA
jgi:hypothetical protein